MKKRYIVATFGIFCVVSVAVAFGIRANNDSEKLTRQVTEAYYNSISYTMEEGSYDEEAQTAIFQVTFPDLQAIYQQLSSDQSEAAIMKAVAKNMDKYSKTVSVQVPVKEKNGEYIPQMDSEWGELLYEEIDKFFMSALLDAELEPIELVVNPDDGQ